MKVIRIYETLLQSIVSDIFSYVCLAGLWLLNHKLCGGSGIIDLFVGLLFVVAVCGKSQKRFTVKTAVEFLRSEEARQFLTKEESQSLRTTAPSRH